PLGRHADRFGFSARQWIGGKRRRCDRQEDERRENAMESIHFFPRTNKSATLRGVAPGSARSRRGAFRLLTRPEHALHRRDRPDAFGDETLHALAFVA